MKRHVIFGAGPLGRFTAEALLSQGLEVRLISRTGQLDRPPVGAEVCQADAFDSEAIASLVKGAETLYQCAQPAYHRWAEDFPPLQNAILEAAVASGAKLVAAENLYMYGDPLGKPLTETTEYRPCSRKGRVRRDLTVSLFETHKAGRVRAASVRGSDFFGPWDVIQGEMLFRAALEGKPVNVIGRLDQPHTLTYVKDFGRALALAGTDDKALGRAWHVPSGPALTQGQFLDLVAEALGHPVKARPAGRFLLNLLGLFNPTIKEVAEMVYEFNAPFVMDASAMENTFGLKATPMKQRIEETLDWVKSRAGKA